MYPVLNIESVISHATNLFRFMEAAVRQGLMTADAAPANQGIKDENTNVLKMVLAIALTVEGSGQSDTGNRLFESVKGAADAILHGESASIKSLPLLVLVVSLTSSLALVPGEASSASLLETFYLHGDQLDQDNRRHFADKITSRRCFISIGMKRALHGD